MVSHAGDTKSHPKTGRRNRVSIWRVVVVCILVACIVGAAFIVGIWAKRRAIIADVLIERFAAYDILADITVKEITPTGIVLGDVALSYEDDIFFRASRIAAEYVWRDVMRGHVKRVVLTRPVLTLNLDHAGAVIDEWVPRALISGNTGGASNTFPPQGIVVKDGQFILSSPYGHITSTVTANISGVDHFNAALNIQQAHLSYGVIAGQFSGPVHFDQKGSRRDITFDLRANNFVSDVANVENMRVNATLSLDKPGQHYRMDGPINVDMSGLTHANFKLAHARAIWDGTLSLAPAVAAIHDFEGRWGIDVSGVQPDAARREAWSEQLSLYKALSATPIATHFADDIRNMIRGIMEEADIRAQGRAVVTPTERRVSLSQPMTITGRETEVTLVPSDKSALYEEDRARATRQITGALEFAGPRHFKLDTARITMVPDPTGEASLNEASLNETLWDMQGVFVSAKTWRTQTKLGKPVRLAPLRANISVAQTPNARQIHMDGALDYDGDVPGGYVKDLQTAGVLNVTSVGSRLEVGFMPHTGRTVKIARFDTPVDWRAENIDFQMASSAPFFKRRRQAARLSGDMAAVNFTLIDAADTRHLDVHIPKMSVQGTLAQMAQNWQITAEKAEVASEDTPSPDTRILADAVDIDVKIRPDFPPQFSISTRAADVTTQLVKAKQIKVDMSGTPLDYTIDYGPGAVKFASQTLPELPMTGQVSFINEAWTGRAQTALPGAENFPVYVDYRFAEGRGDASVHVPELVFEEQGLQPQDLVSPLKGKVGAVNGATSAIFNVSFGVGVPLRSSGQARLMSVDIGTLPGPFSGVSTDLVFSSILPLQTDGIQHLNMARFDPGFPLENGEIDFEIRDGEVEIHRARWPLGSGFVSIDPVIWKTLNPKNRVTLRVEDVSIGEFVKDFGGERLRATGDVSGILPVEIDGVNVNVNGGYLRVKDGGVIQYTAPQTDAAAEQSEQAKLAFDALKNFEYKSLELRLDGPLDGNLALRAEFDGKNADVLYGASFDFDVGIEGELLNIVRGFDPQNAIRAAKQAVQDGQID